MAKSVDKTFITNIKISNLTLKEQNTIFAKIYNCLDIYERENIEVICIDGCGGQHNLTKLTGVSPNGDFCKNCNALECANCKHYKEILDK